MLQAWGREGLLDPATRCPLKLLVSPPVVSYKPAPSQLSSGTLQVTLAKRPGICAPTQTSALSRAASAPFPGLGRREKANIARPPTPPE